MLTLGLVTGFIGGWIISFLANCFLKNSSNRKRKISETDRRIFTLVESSKDIIYHYQVKPEQRFIYLSPALDTIMGAGSLQRSYNDAHRVFDKIHPDDYEILYNKVYGTADYSKPILQRWLDTKGNYIWFEEYATPVYEDGKFIAIEGIMRNISDKVALQKKLEYRLTHDALTNIHNREFFEKTMEKYNKDQDVAIAIILCDLDELKYMNDFYGHKAGDLLIKETANLLNRFSSENVLVSRIGGDEFAIVMPNISGIEEVEKLLFNIEEDTISYVNENDKVHIKLSMGYAISDYSLARMEELFTEADKNMYINKSSRKEAQRSR